MKIFLNVFVLKNPKKLRLPRKMKKSIKKGLMQSLIEERFKFRKNGKCKAFLKLWVGNF